MLQRLAVSSFASLAAPLAAAVSAFFVTPVLLHSLGDDVYGMWVVCASVAAYAGLLDLGMSGAATRFLAGALGDGESDRRASLFLSFRRFYRLVGVGLFAIGLIVAAGSLLPTDGSPWRNGLLVVGILLCSSGLSFLFRIYAAVLRANIEYQAIALAAVLRTIVYTAVVLFAAEHFDLVSLALLFAALALGEQLMVWIQARRHAPPRIELENNRPAEFRPIFGHAGKSVVAGVASILRWKTDTQVIGGFVSLGAVTQYSVGMKLPQLFFDLLYTFFGSQYVAAFSQWRSKYPDADSREIVALGMKACAILSFTGACVLFFLVPPFLERWLGPGFDEAKQLARILLPFWAFMAMPIPLSNLLVAESRHGGIAKLSIIGAVGNVVLSLILVVPFGAKGVVIATACEMLAQIVFYAWWVAPQVGWRPADFLLRRITYPYLRFALIAFPACGFLGTKILSPSYPSIILGAILLSLLSLIIAVLTITNSGDRRTILSLARKNFER